MAAFLFNLESVEDNSLRIYNKYPNSKITGVFSFNKPMILIKDPDIIRQITIKDFEYFINHPTVLFNEETDPILTNNIFQLKDDEWKKTRAVFSPAFTANKLRIICGLMQECSDQFVDYYKNLLKQHPKSEIQIDLKDVLLKYSVNVIASTVFGIQINSFTNPNNEFYRRAQQTRIFKSFIRFITIPLCPKLFKMLGIGLVPKNVLRFFTRICLDSIRQREELHIYRPDVLNLFLEEKNKNHEDNKPVKVLTNDDIINLSFGFFIAGLDTTTNLMCAAILELSLNQDCQKKLYQEVKTHMIDQKNEITYELLKDMKYLDMVVSETLRKWPLAAQTDRRCNQDYVLNVDGRNLPIKTGTIIALPLFPLARDPKYFPNPDLFDPERFSPENKNKIHPATYIPFGIGPRQCIGLRFAIIDAKVIVANIVKNFEILPMENVQLPIKLKKGSVEVMPDCGFYVKLKIRD